MPRRFHRLDQFRPAMFRQPALEHFHKRLLLLKRQSIGGIQNLCKLCHDRNVADRRTLGNDDFGGAENKNAATVARSGLVKICFKAWNRPFSVPNIS
jgi:hypothetical protein